MPSTYLNAARGEDLPQSKLTEALVRMIRRQHARKERLKRMLDERYSAEAFAERIGVSASAIHKVITYGSWRHVPDEEPDHRQRQLLPVSLIKSGE